MKILKTKRGVVLVIVLIIFFLATVICGIILSLYTSQARLNEHYIKRIQAYYAALGGMWWALDRLRIGSLAPGSTAMLNFVMGSRVYNVTITVSPTLDPTNGCYPVNMTVNYTSP